MYFILRVFFFIILVCLYLTWHFSRELLCSGLLAVWQKLQSFVLLVSPLYRFVSFALSLISFEFICIRVYVSYWISLQVDVILAWSSFGWNSQLIRRFVSFHCLKTFLDNLLDLLVDFFFSVFIFFSVVFGFSMLLFTFCFCYYYLFINVDTINFRYFFPFEMTNVQMSGAFGCETKQKKN